MRQSLIVAMVVSMSLGALAAPSKPQRSKPAAAPATTVGTTQKPTAPTSTHTPTKGTSSATGPAQQQNLSKLAGDLSSMKSGSSVTPAQQQAMAADLMAMANGATTPDPALVNSLSADLSAALSNGSLSSKEAMKLASDVEAVMNSANIPKSEVDKAITDAQAILTASGVSKSDAQQIANDLRAIATELQKNVSSTTSPSTRKRPGKPSS